MATIKTIGVCNMENPTPILNKLIYIGMWVYNSESFFSCPNVIKTWTVQPIHIINIAHTFFVFGKVTITFWKKSIAAKWSNEYKIDFFCTKMSRIFCVHF